MIKKPIAYNIWIIGSTLTLVGHKQVMVPQANSDIVNYSIISEYFNYFQFLEQDILIYVIH